VLTEAGEATEAIARFDAEAGHRMAPFSSILLRSESTASSRIEQLTASAKAIALAELGDERSSNASMIVSNVAAMDAAIALADDLDEAAVIEMHTALLEHEHPEWTGHWRNTQVWIGGGRFGPQRAMFVPPHHQRVAESMSDLMTFARRDDVPALVQAAIAHAQFETVHPFPDGNGRTGRALVHAMLRRRGVTRSVTVPISAGLLVDIGAYFDALGAYRDGDPSVIVGQMSDAV
jgi:Fic family protein